MDKNTIGKKFKRLRELNGYTKDQVAQMCEINVLEMVDIESGAKYPGENTLKVLLDSYHVTLEEVERNDYVNHDRRIRVINYVQIGITVLLLFLFIMPFQMNGSMSNLQVEATGFQMLFSGYYYGTSLFTLWLFIVLGIELGLQILLFTKLMNYSNILKGIFLLVDLVLLVLMYMVFTWNWTNAPITMWTFIALFIIHMGIIVYDMIKYPVSNDFVQDKGRNRRIYVLVVQIVYFIFYCVILYGSILDDSFQTLPIVTVFFIVWGVYHLAYFFIPKEKFEERMFSTLTLLIPPICFAFMYVVEILDSAEEVFEPMMILTIMIMLLPSLLVNIDYFIDLLRNFITKGDKKTIKHS